MNLTFIRSVDYTVGIPLCFILGQADWLWRKLFQQKHRKPPQKILLIKTWGMGNIVLMLPTLKRLKETFPQTEISLFSMDSNQGIVMGNPYLDNFFLIKTKSLTRFFLSFFHNLYALRKEKFDIVLDFDQFSRFAALVAYLSGAPERIGFDTAGQGKKWIFTCLARYNNNQHMALTFSEIARAIGVQFEDVELVKVPATYYDKLAVDRYLKQKKISPTDLCVGIHIGSGQNFPGRRWPIERFAEVAQKLVQAFGAKIFFTGILSEKPPIEETIRQIHLPPDQRDSIIDTSGCFNARELAILISKCGLFLSCDTGPLHIASAMGTPVIAFFGPNTPTLYGPRGAHHTIFYKNLHCSPCLTNYNSKNSRCKDYQCMTQITVEEVMAVIGDKYLKTSPFLANRLHSGGNNVVWDSA